MSVKFFFQSSIACKNIAVYFLPRPTGLHIVFGLEVCSISSGISGPHIFMIWRKWCHQKPRFCSWNGTKLRNSRRSQL